MTVIVERRGTRVRYICFSKEVFQHGKTSKRKPLPRETFLPSNYTPSQMNVCINARTVYIQPAIHDCGNKALYVTTFSFRQFKEMLDLVNSHDKIAIPCMR